MIFDKNQMDSQTTTKITKLGESIYKLGEKSGKESAKKMAKSEIGKRLGKIVDSVTSKAESKKLSIDNQKLKKVCLKVGTSDELTYAEVQSLAVSALSRLALMNQPPKATKSKKQQENPIEA
jgi:hypothetical protein